MTNADPKQAAVLAYVESIGEEWARNLNPVDIWYAIKVCVDRDAPFPAWIREYLGECGDRALKSRFDRHAAGDSREALLRIFLFSRPRGKPSYFALARDKYENERFAMAFAAAIFEGKTPGAAQRAATSELSLGSDADRDDGGRDDRTLQRLVKRYFGLARLPGGNAKWRIALAEWFLRQNIFLLEHYREVFPAIPDRAHLHALVGGTYTLAASGKLSRVSAGTSKTI